MQGAFFMLENGGEQMARDDYHVVVYKILSYLYQCLKRGDKVNAALLQYDSPMLKINQSYWEYIIYNLYTEGYINGIALIPIDSREYPFIHELDKANVTPKGIEYLCDNSFMEKAKQFLKDVKETVPFM